MIRFELVVAQFPDLDAPELADWIARGWIVPQGSTRADWAFAAIDVARIVLRRLHGTDFHFVAVPPLDLHRAVHVLQNEVAARLEWIGLLENPLDGRETRNG